jgi:hypothetical protein
MILSIITLKQHETQHMDNQQNDTQDMDIQHYDPQHNNTQHYKIWQHETQHNGTQHVDPHSAYLHLV